MNDRRQFLKQIRALAAVAPLGAIDMRDGKVRQLSLEPGHYLFIVDCRYVDPSDLVNAFKLPKGATGGWIVGVHGRPDDVFKAYKL